MLVQQNAGLLRRFSRRKASTTGNNLHGHASSIARLFWLDASQGLVGCQLEFFDLTLDEIPDLGLQRRLGDSPHLEGERDRVLRRPTGCGGTDQCRSGKVCAIKVRSERNDQNRFQNTCQRIALPDHHGPTACLFPRSICAEVGPPEFSSLQLCSVVSSALAHSARPCSARARSSALPAFASLAKSQRPATGRRTTIKLTLSPDRRLSRSAGRKTPFS